MLERNGKLVLHFTTVRQWVALMYGTIGKIVYLAQPVGLLLQLSDNTCDFLSSSRQFGIIGYSVAHIITPGKCAFSSVSSLHTLASTSTSQQRES